MEEGTYGITIRVTDTSTGNVTVLSDTAYVVDAASSVVEALLDFLELEHRPRTVAEPARLVHIMVRLVLGDPALAAGGAFLAHGNRDWGIGNRNEDQG